MTRAAGRTVAVVVAYNRRDLLIEVLDALAECLGGHFDTEHCTFQLEPASHAQHEPARHD